MTYSYKSERIDHLLKERFTGHAGPLMRGFWAQPIRICIRLVVCSGVHTERELIKNNHFRALDAGQALKQPQQPLVHLLHSVMVHAHVGRKVGACERRVQFYTLAQSVPRGDGRNVMWRWSGGGGGGGLVVAVERCGPVLDLEMRHETFLQHVYIIYLYTLSSFWCVIVCSSMLGW